MTATANPCGHDPRAWRSCPRCAIATASALIPASEGDRVGRLRRELEMLVAEPTPDLLVQLERLELECVRAAKRGAQSPLFTGGGS